MRDSHRELPVSLLGFLGLVGLFGLAGLFFVGLLLLTPTTARADAGRPPAASASMPLEDVLRLYRERDRALERDERDQPPPVDAVVDRLEIEGRLLDDALELRAEVQLTVLAEDRWVHLPLLRLSPSTVLGDLPAGLRGAALVVKDGELAAVAIRDADRPATLRFEMRWLERAKVDGDLRKVELKTGAATLARLTLELDESLFRLEGVDAGRQGEQYRVFPSRDGFELAWRRLRPKSAETAATRPPIEPVISEAHLSTVSTLEGDVHHRLRYDLRFEGPRELDFTLPPGVELKKAYVNGRSVPFEIEDGRLSLSVEPARAGDRRGRVELSLRPAREAYHLSGELFLTLPAVSWPVNHLYARLHLPQVFDYRWSGGSLAPTEQAPTPDFTENLPTPGDLLLFHQPLVQGSQPTVRVAYDIDLEGQIFGGR